MKNNTDNSIIKVSTENVILQPRTSHLIAIHKSDWEELKRKITFLPTDIKWWEFLTTFGFTHAISMIITFQTLDSNSSTIASILEKSGYVGATIGLMSLIFMLAQRKQIEETKDSIKNYMDYLSDQYSEEIEEERLLREIENWQSKKTDNPQGASFKPIVLGESRFQGINFTIETEDPYWRVGIKLSKNETSYLESNLLTKDSILIHVHRTNDSLGLVMYENGNPTMIIDEEINIRTGLESITFSMQVTRTNQITIEVNNQSVKQIDIDTDYLKYLSLCTWADDSEYSVNLKDIAVKTR